MLDFEVSSGLSRQSMSRWALRFLDRYEALTGVRPIVYTYPYFLSGRMDAGMLRGEKLWYADYTGVGGRYRYLRFTTGLKVVAQQYTSSGAVKGVRGRCDMNFAQRLSDILVSPEPHHTDNFWTWLRWWLGEGEFKKHGPRRGPRPDVPKRIPFKWWRRAAAFIAKRRKKGVT